MKSSVKEFISKLSAEQIDLLTGWYETPVALCKEEEAKAINEGGLEAQVEYLGEEWVTLQEIGDALESCETGMTARQYEAPPDEPCDTCGQPIRPGEEWDRPEFDLTQTHHTNAADCVRAAIRGIMRSVSLLPVQEGK